VGEKPDDELLGRRMMKEAVHELGHVFGLRNCAEQECVMYLPRNLKELDKKSDSFCLSCQKEFRVLKQPQAPDSGAVK
jgi:archaemetzincin